MKYFLVLSVLCVYLTQAEIQNGTLPLQEMLNFEMIFVYPSNVFNSSCVGKSCLGLSNASLCNSDSSVNNEATLQALSKCMKGTICGIEMDSRKIPIANFSLTQVLPTWVPFKSDCSTSEHDFYLNSAPTITSIGQNKFALTNPELTLHGIVACNFYISVPSLLPGMPATEVPLVSNVPMKHKFISKLTSILTVNAKSVATISNPKLEVSSVNFFGFEFPKVPEVLKVLKVPKVLEKLPGEDLTNIFTDMVKVALGNFSLASSLRDFQLNLINSTLQFVSNKCKNSG